MDDMITIPGLGLIGRESGFIQLRRTSDGMFQTGRNGVVSVSAPRDRKVEFVAFTDHTLAHVQSAMGYPAYYPVHPTELRHPVKAVLMDLDGTSVHSERFWIRMIEMTTAALVGNSRFELEAADFPFVSGHSVSEHLSYCIRKYTPLSSVEEARRIYFELTRREMEAVLEGREGIQDSFRPAPGLANFLREVKSLGIKIGLVTSGLFEKAWPEIYAAFQVMGLGDPRDFYDAIVTAGFPMRPGETGTLGELTPKPHPWLYAEIGRIGLGIDFESRNSVLGIEDSGAGICAVRLAGYPVAGVAGGNIIASGTRALCNYFCHDLSEVLGVIKGNHS